MKIRLLVVASAAAALASLQPYRPFVVSGESMKPTFASGQVVVAKIRPQRLSRGSVIVFQHEGEMMVKRVAYLPGDSVERFFFVNEWQLPLSERSHQAMRRNGYPHRREVVPPGHIFVLADNPHGSIDSRTLGPIPTGEVWAVVPNTSPAAEWSLEGAQRGSAMFARL